MSLAVGLHANARGIAIGERPPLKALTVRRNF